jgi:hypothetical protein
MDDDLLTVSEAAALIGISRQAVHGRIRRGTWNAVPSAQGPLVRRSSVVQSGSLQMVRDELARLRKRLAEAEGEIERLRRELAQ